MTKLQQLVNQRFRLFQRNADIAAKSQRTFAPLVAAVDLD
jgi:hypothetical protein